MTDFTSWEKKAAALVKQDKEEEEREKKENNAALGLKEGLDGIEGPSIAKSKKERKELDEKSLERKLLIEKINRVEIVIDGVVDGKIGEGNDGEKEGEKKTNDVFQVVSVDSVDGDEKKVCEIVRNEKEEQSPPTENGEKRQYALRLKNCENSTIRINTRIVKLLVENCKNCTIQTGDVISSSSEIWNCEGCSLRFDGPMLSVQADNCNGGSSDSNSKPLSLDWSSQEFADHIVHHKCEGLKFCVEGNEREEVVDGASGGAGPGQKFTKLIEKDGKGCFVTCGCERSNGGAGYPVFMGKNPPTSDTNNGSGSVPTPARNGAQLPSIGEDEEISQEAANTSTLNAASISNTDNNGTPIDPEQAYQTARQQGNEAFKTSDYMQAIAHYTLAIQAKEQSTGKGCSVVYSNRAQCWLKVGNMEKAIKDCDSAIELDGEPSTMAKAWFRRGMAYHQKACEISSSKDAMSKVDINKKSEEAELEALNSLGKAEKLDPKNKQVKDSIGMVSISHRRRKEKEMRERGGM